MFKKSLILSLSAVFVFGVNNVYAQTEKELKTLQELGYTKDDIEKSNERKRKFLGLDKKNNNESSTKKRKPLELEPERVAVNRFLAGKDAKCKEINKDNKDACFRCYGVAYPARLECAKELGFVEY